MLTAGDLMKINAFDDILEAFLITYAMAAFSFEKYVPEKITGFLRVIVFAAFALVWLWNSYKSGRERRAAFPIFAVCFWLLPQLIIYLADSGPEVFRMSVAMYVLSEFSELLANVPIKITGGIIGTSTFGAAAIILLLCGACNFFGRFRADE